MHKEKSTPRSLLSRRVIPEGSASKAFPLYRSFRPLPATHQTTHPSTRGGLYRPSLSSRRMLSYLVPSAKGLSRQGSLWGPVLPLREKGCFCRWKWTETGNHPGRVKCFIIGKCEPSLNTHGKRLLAQQQSL